MKTECYLMLIDAGNLSAKDQFLQYRTRTVREKNTKKLILEAIKFGVKSFYRPIYDPSFIDDDKIQFIAGKAPAVGQPQYWWKNAAQKYNPSRNSRLGTRLEYGAFLGVLIKMLVEEGNSVEWAWNAVCNDSKELGHYWNSENAKHTFEPTGSRSICGLFDLANTYKILAEDVSASCFWIAGGNCGEEGNLSPIASIECSTTCSRNYFSSVGWIVCN